MRSARLAYRSRLDSLGAALHGESVKKDLQATAEKHFEDKRSYVAKDGREILYGKDWTARKLEVWERGKGRCERMVGTRLDKIYERCRNEMTEPHHIVKRSKQRDDRLANLEGLCHLHHDLLDPRKPQWSNR